MKLIAGLGNPGPEYALTRHNIGFLCLDALVEAYGFSEFKPKGKGAFSEGHIGTQKVLLYKPLDFMNRSGPPLQKIKDFYKVDADSIFVVHDDLDLAPGKVRVKHAGGHGGHNGLKSIDQAMGNSYWRVRVGIGRPPHMGQNPAHYVLERFHKDEEAWLVPFLQAWTDHIALLFSEDPTRFTAAVMQDISCERAQ